MVIIDTRASFFSSYSAIAALCISLGISSCGSKDDNGGSANGSRNQAPGGTSTTPTPPPNIPFDTALLGKWDSPCIASKINPPAFETTTFDFNSRIIYQRERRLFTDSKCQTALAIETEIGSYGLSGPIDSNSDISNLTLTVQRFSEKPTSVAGVSAFNSMKLCGFTNWILNGTKDVTGVNCLGYTFSQNDLRKELVSLRDGRLYFGKRTADASGHIDFVVKPSELDAEVVYQHR